MRCDEKVAFASRMAAEKALAHTRRDWHRFTRLGRTRDFDQPPVRVYLCRVCLKWHLTHQPLA